MSTENKLFIDEDLRIIELHSEINQEISAEFCSFIRYCNKFDKLVQESSEIAVVREFGEIEEDGEMIEGVLDKTVHGDDYEPKPITIYLSTEGGVCTEGFAMCDAIRLSETPIKIIATGEICSMGLPILVSSKDRVCTKYTTFMFHGVSGGDYGKINNRRQVLEHSEQLQDFLKEIMVNNTKFSIKELDEILEGCGEYYFYPEKAIELGVVNSII